MPDAAADDPGLGDRGAFCCVASLPAQGRLFSLSRIAAAFRPSSGGGGGGAASRAPSSSSASHPAVRAVLDDVTSAWSGSPSALPPQVVPTSPTAASGGVDGASTPTCRLVRSGSLTGGGGGGGGGGATDGNGDNSSNSSIIETVSFASAGLAVRQEITDCIHLCPILGAAYPASASPPSTLARVVPYALFAPHAFVAVSGHVANTDELARRFAARRPASASASSTAFLRTAQSAPLPTFEAARDAALAEELSCLSLTPPAGSSASSSSSSAFAAAAATRSAAAALSGVRRAVDAGEATARALLAMFEDAVAGAGARAADWPAQALTLALADVQGTFALVLHDAERGCTLAARDASGEEDLWFCLPPDGSCVLFATRPVDVPSVGGAAASWHEVPAGHFVVLGGGMGRSPRLHQFALTPEQLHARAAQDGYHSERQGASAARSGVPLGAAAAAAADAVGHGGGAAGAAPGSPHSGGGSGDHGGVARWSLGAEDLVYE